MVLVCLAMEGHKANQCTKEGLAPVSRVLVCAAKDRFFDIKR